MKRLEIYYFPILLLLLMALTSCGGNYQKKTYKIGVSQCSSDDWRRKMNEEIEREILFHPEAKVEIRSADDSNEKQISDIKYFVDNKFDIIIAAPNEAEALTPVIKEVYDAGIPVILFDRNINGHSYTAWQGADNHAIGVEAARYAEELENQRPDSGKIIELYGLAGSTPAIERSRGFNETIDGISSLQIVGRGFGDWNYETAYGVADSLMAAHPDIDIVYAHNDRMALAAHDVAQKRGITPYIIGVDAAPQIGVKAVSEGKITATFMYPTEGHQLIRTAMDILEGRPYDKNLKIPTLSPITSKNADLLLLQNQTHIAETSRMKELKEQLDNYWKKYSSQTILFYSSLVIIILVVMLVFVVLRRYWSSRKHQSQLMEQNRLLEEERNKQKILNEELEKATQAKLVFFTNVSHDLRTPLTLISEPVAQLRQAPNLTAGQKALMNIADKNVKILHRLINQILDFRKYENGKLDLNLSETELSPLAEEWASSFQTLARSRDIHFNIDIESGIVLAIDRGKIERVVFNLLSNAFKHTPANGEITFGCKVEADNLIITVDDTGEGIPPEEVDLIFDRFYQVDKINPKGSGIGLSLAKAFVKLHQGEITVESQPGKGTDFKVTIPVNHVEPQTSMDGENGPTEEVVPTGESRAIKEAIDSAAALAETTITQQKEFDPDKPLVLLVDDNEDMRAMISGLLEDRYNVALAGDGKEGLRMAVKYTPDLIISDVMMPVMDGMEFCAKVKEEVSTSHIPVLLLTACSLDEQRAEGYESGADGYISKPFGIEVLKARCRSLIENRRRIRNLWNSTVSPSAGDKEKEEMKANASKASALSPIDSEFYARFLNKVEENMGNADMNVDSLAGELGLGRSQFYRKIKALTNYSPVELLRRLRLQRARDLLVKTEKSISEIAYEVGFSTPAYFTKCFRDMYEVTPTELRTSLGS